MSYTMFNRVIQRASNRTLDYITGDASGIVPPFSYSTQKAKDFIGKLITPYSAPIISGTITKPADYYTFDNLYILSLSQNGCEQDNTDCDSGIPIVEIIGTPVEMLDGQQFKERCRTWTKSKRPSPEVPICKVIGNTIEFYPKELGSCTLEYIRYPIAGTINTMIDPVYYAIVADPATSINCEWDEWARDMLIFFATDSFANFVREDALKKFNEATGKTVRG